MGIRTARRLRGYRVSVKFVNYMVILKRETGGLEPRQQVNGGGHGKLGRLRDWIAARMAAKPDLTLDDLVLELVGCTSDNGPPRLGLAHPPQYRFDT